MINSVYGKSMKNLRKRINISLVNNERGFLKYTSKPTHITHKIFAKNYAVIHEIKPVLMLKKTIYAGLTVLELSKWLLYNFHYNFIKKIYIELLFTGTDNFTHKIKSEDVYEEFFKHTHLFHFSNYPEESFDQANKKAIGKMRDESKGKIIDEFIGLTSKMYSIETVDGKESNTTKRENIATEFNEFKATFTILQI